MTAQKNCFKIFAKQFGRNDNYVKNAQLTYKLSGTERGFSW